MTRFRAALRGLWIAGGLTLVALVSAGCAEADNQGDLMTESTSGRNRLASEQSPYLLQHADNPVDWYPWGEEAFALARAQDKPIFLSIGYSTCHWCHVMEHESFENDSIAAVMNELFVNIKIDREERPDLDHLYMKSVQAITRQGGGWPLSVFLTPDLKPYFGGTYFPPEDRYGRPGFPSVLRQMAEVYRTQRDEIDRVTANLITYLETGPAPGSDVPPDSLLEAAHLQHVENFDAKWGGFGPAPKFPRTMALSFLMRHHRRSGDPRALSMVTRTLDKMAAGGMHDHLGGGFHRYSVDDKWLAPHFEKMLYDNALLARTYIEAYQLTGEERYAATARDIFTYLLRDMASPEGAFFAAEDADSEGEEGTFYLWTRAEIDALLGDQSDLLCAYYDVTDSGNFEGSNILWTPQSADAIATAHGLAPKEMHAQLATLRDRLLAVRSKRVRPHRDEKVLTSWNGLVLGAFALGYQVLGDAEYLNAARRIADFTLEKMWDGQILSARWANGDVRYDGYLDDYAFTAWGLFDLYEAGFETKYLKAAFALLDTAEEHFATDNGGYYFAPVTNTDLLARSEEVYDGAMPSGTSVMALNLLKRAEYTGDLSFKDRAAQLLKAYRSELEQHPSSFTQMLCALDFFYGKPREVVIAGTEAAADELLRALRRGFTPNKVVLLNRPGDETLAELAPITKGKSAEAGKALAYVCRDFTCKLPTADPNLMLTQLGE